MFNSSNGSERQSSDNEKVSKRKVPLKIALIAALILVAVLFIALLVVPNLMSAPARHSGDLILKANETMTIDRPYQQEGNIVVKDNATLIIRNAELIIYQPTREYSIEVRDNANLTTDNAQFTVHTSYAGFLLYPDSTIYVEDNATALFSHSDVVSVTVNASQSSRVTVTDCQFYDGSILSSDTSTISVLDSDARSISCQGFSTVTAKKSGASWYACSGSSSLLVEDTRNTGIIDCYSNATVTVNNSTIYGVSADAFLGKICFSDSLINEQIYVDNTSDFYFCGNVTINGGIADFKGQMTRNYDAVTSSNKQLSVLDRDTGKTLLTTTADNSGYASFDLVFTPANYTDHLLINGEDFNSTSTTPLTVN
jgi:hypothetical protein